jgi:hypothetical protein
MTPIPLGILALSGAFASGAYDLLETTTLTTNASSVTFSGLGAYSDYKHLQIRLVARNNLATNTGTMRITFNSDSSASYTAHRLRGTGSAVDSQAFTNQSSLFAGTIQGAISTSNVFSPMIIDILDFASTSKNTTIRTLNGHSNFITLLSGLFFKTNAITSVNISPDTGNNFVPGSRFSLYGVK